MPNHSCSLSVGPSARHGAAGKVFLFDGKGLEGLLRIGSFVAPGFSLIGMGWLYNRQLAGAAAQTETAPG